MSDTGDKGTEGDEAPSTLLREARPSGVSWVDKLKALQAKAQCLAWGLTPANTLEANRVILKEFINSGAAPSLPASHVPAIDGSVNEPTLGVITPQPDWQGLVQATAVAVGAQVAKALAEASSHKPTAHHGSGSKIVSDMVEALPSISGANPRQLVKFLISFNQIRQLGLVPPGTLILNTLPKTKDQLRSVWSLAVQNKLSESSLIVTVLDNFLPRRLRQQTVNDLIYRVQSPTESLAEFVSDIQSVASLLLPDCQNSQLLDTVITGLNPPN